MFGLQDRPCSEAPGEGLSDPVSSSAGLGSGHVCEHPDRAGRVCGCHRLRGFRNMVDSDRADCIKLEQAVRKEQCVDQPCLVGPCWECAGSIYPPYSTQSCISGIAGMLCWLVQHLAKA